MTRLERKVAAQIVATQHPTFKHMIRSVAALQLLKAELQAVRRKVRGKKFCNGSAGPYYQGWNDACDDILSKLEGRLK